MSYNEHTGDKLQSKVSSEEYRNNFDLIFKKVKRDLNMLDGGILSKEQRQDVIEMEKDASKTT